ADHPRVLLPVPVADEVLSPAARLDAHVGEQDPRLDPDRGDAREVHPLLARREPAALAAPDRVPGDFEAGGEDEVAARPAAGLEDFGHGDSSPILTPGTRPCRA